MTLNTFKCNSLHFKGLSRGHNTSRTR